MSVENPEVVVEIATSDSQQTSSSSSEEDCDDLCSLQFILRQYVKQLVSRPNSATYLSQTIDYVAASYEFNSFLEYVENYPEPGKSQLASTLFPVFVHLYLVVLLSSEKAGLLDAHAFYELYHHVFTNAEGYEGILKELYELKTDSEVRNHSYYKKFWENKYVINVTKEVLQDLHSFFARIKSKALLYVFHFHFYYESVDVVELKSDSYGNDDDFDENFDDKTSCEDEGSLYPDDNSAVISTVELPPGADPMDIDVAMDSEAVISDVTEQIEDSELKNVSYKSLLEKMNVVYPRISTVVVGCKRSDVRSVDFNKNETELCVSLGEPCLYILSLVKEQLPEKPKEEEVELVDQSDETDQNDETDQSHETGQSTTSSKSSGTEKTAESPENSECPKSSENDEHNISDKNNENDTSDRSDKNWETINDESSEISPTERQKSDSEKNFEVEMDMEIDGEETANEKKRIQLPHVVTAIKYLPDEDSLLLMACNAEVKLFDTKTERITSTFDSGHNNDIWDFDFNSSRTLFASASEDKTSCIWNFNQSSVVRKFAGHLAGVNIVRFHRNDLYLITGSSDCTVRLWNIENGLTLRIFVSDESPIHSIACSIDGKVFASGDSLGIVKIWDINDGSKIAELSCCETNVPHLNRVTGLCFSQNDYILTACTFKGIMKTWALRSVFSDDPTKCDTKQFQNTPLLIKYGKYGIWKIIFRRTSTVYEGELQL